MSSPWRHWAQTHTGTVRSRNEDALVSRPDLGLWAVADGAGGHEHGDVASNLLAEALTHLPEGLTGLDLITEVRSRIAETHLALRERADVEATVSGAQVMIASTIVLLMASSSHYACLWAGDSRVYRLRDGAMTLLSRDHSLVQDLIDQGTIEENEAENHVHANVITRAVGAEGPPPLLDKVTDRAFPGDRFLLCSDGLTKSLPESEIARLMAKDDPAVSLIEASLANNARDNVTAVIVELCAESPEPDDDEPTLSGRPAAGDVAD